MKYSIALLFLALISSVSADSKLDKKIEEQDARIAELEKKLNAKDLDDVKKSEKKSEKESDHSQTSVKYDKGYVISTKSDVSDDVFSLKINGRMQFRYTGFARNGETFEFDDGKTGRQTNQNDFEVERGRLEFSGNVADPKLQFYINLDADTDDNHDVKFHDFWFNYVFAKEFNLYAGKAFVPGSREWLEGSTTTHLSDRSMATSFFRPDRSLGVWASGEVEKGLFYRTMVSNGFNTTDLKPDEIDDKFTYAASIWGDLVGDYGKGRADLEHHADLAVRVGSSFTYSPASANADEEPLGEADAVRLSDGTRLDAEGALVDGVTVNEYDIFLYAADFSAKFRGLSLNSEFYFRSIKNINANGAIPMDNFDDLGAYADVGYFIYQDKLEAVVRYSFVNGDVADSAEYAGGLNWYVNGTHNNKLTLDVARLDDSPVNSSGPNYRVGDNGVLSRLQWQVAF